jgi:hypothetical protein
MGRGAARGGARALVATEMKAVVSSCRSARSCFPAFPPAAGASPLRATSSCSRFTCRSIASRSACKSAALPHRPAASGRIPRELAPGRSRAPVFSNNFHGVEQLSRSCSNASRSLRGISLGHVRPTCTGRGRDVRPICTGRGRDVRPICTGGEMCVPFVPGESPRVSSRAASARTGGARQPSRAPRQPARGLTGDRTAPPLRARISTRARGVPPTSSIRTGCPIA